METPLLTAEIRPLPDRRTLISTASGKHYSLTIEVSDFFRLVDAWFGGIRDPLLPATWRDDSRALYELLKAEGVVSANVPGEEASVDVTRDKGVPKAGGLLVAGEVGLASRVVRAFEEVRKPNPEVFLCSGDYRHVVECAKNLHAPVLYCHPTADDLGFGFFARLAATARVDWVPLTTERDCLWVGPCLRPGDGAQFQDLHERRIAAADHEVVGRALREQPLNFPVSSTGLATRLLDVPELVERVLTTPDLLCQVDLSSTRITEHVVIPIPRNPDVLRAPHGLADMVSPECGIVTRQRRIEHHSSLPADLVTVQVEVAHMERITAWDNVISCQGSTWGDEQRAAVAALGETAERYAANMHDTRPLIRATYAQMRRQGVRAVSPESFVLYSDAQYADPDFPAVPFREDTELAWVEGRSESTGENVFVPAALVYTNWRKGERIHEPLIHISPFAGVAAGPNRDFALISAIEELVERHATALWWLNGMVLDRVRLSAELAGLWTGCRGQEPSLLCLPNEFGIPVAAGILRERDAGLLNIGFAARDNLQEAARKAWTEAATLQEGSRDLLTPDSKHLQGIRAGIIPAGAMKPYRADRAYLEDFRPDFSDCTDLMVQQQIYLDPRCQERVAHLIETPLTVELDAVPQVKERSFREYRRLIEAKGYEVFSVDITPPDMQSLGLCVVRVLVPGMVGNAAAAYPLLGKGRVLDIPVEMGWRTTPLNESQINRMPLPHA